MASSDGVENGGVEIKTHVKGREKGRKEEKVKRNWEERKEIGEEEEEEEKREIHFVIINLP